MIRRLLAAEAIALVALGGVAGWFVGRETEDAVTTVETTTVTETTTQTPPETGLPAPVQETHAALLAAAESGDYEELRSLIPATGFEYTFGGPVEGGPIAYWQEIERSTVERPIASLAAVLKMPYTLSRGIYVWPFAYDVADAGDLTAHERELLTPLGALDTLFVPGTGYLGWRGGIEPDGTWVFFVAGD
ncbi:MAG: hypothetical protein ACRDNY_05195 [Gaiellaceae bacterium]